MEQSSIYVQIISPEKTLLEGYVDIIRFPGMLSPFAVLKNHAPLISALIAGSITYQGAELGEGSIPIDGGFVQIHNNRIHACVSQPNKTDEEYKKVL